MPRSCAESAGIPALLSPRDKLAQLLVVGVRDAADAQAVVTNYHVGGILIGSDTDLTILTARWPRSLPAGVRCRWR